MPLGQPCTWFGGVDCPRSAHVSSDHIDRRKHSAGRIHIHSRHRRKAPARSGGELGLLVFRRRELAADLHHYLLCAEVVELMFMLWAGILMAPVAFLLHLQINYSLVPWVCVTGKAFTLHIATVATLLLAGAGCVVAWRSWR